jgi:hypothetical protein
MNDPKTKMKNFKKVGFKVANIQSTREREWERERERERDLCLVLPTWQGFKL